MSAGGRRGPAVTGLWAVSFAYITFTVYGNPVGVTEQKWCLGHIKAYNWWSWAWSLGLWVPEPVFPTVGAGEYLEGAQTKQKSSKVYLAFCKGRLCCVGAMPMLRLPGRRVLRWVKVSAAVVLRMMPPGALCP